MGITKMSYNDILFSRGVSTASIVASGDKIAIGVISNPLSAVLATDADMQIVGTRGLALPRTPSYVLSTPIVGGVIRFNLNPGINRMEVNNGIAWKPIAMQDDIQTNQLTYISPSTYVVNQSLTVVPGISVALSASLIPVALDIQNTNPTIVLRDLSSASGVSSIYMMGGTGFGAGAVNGYQLKVTTDNTSLYGTKLEVNPIVNSSLSSSINSMTLTPYGVEILPAVLSIPVSIINPTLKVRGSAHTDSEALKVDKEAPLSLGVVTDANKVASFNFATDSRMNILATGKVQINGETSAVLAVKAIDGYGNPGYLAKFSQGGYMGTNLDGIYVELSTYNASRNLAVFNSKNGSTVVSAAKIDGIGNMFVNGNVGIGTTTTTNKLHVIGSGEFTGEIRMGYVPGVPSVSGTSGILVRKQGSLPSIEGINSGYAPGTDMVINPLGGNIGIGTTLPVSSIHIRGGTPLTWDSWGAADNDRAFNFNISGSNYGKIVIPAGSGGAMAFWTGSAGSALERMRIDYLGNVGIGTNNPSVKLEVNGNAKISTAIITAANISTDLSVTGNTYTGALRTPSANITTATVNTLNVTGTLNLTAQGLLPTGMIIMWPTASPPTGWELCNGGTIPASTTYDAIRSVLAPSTTFPNLSQRFPLGAGSANPLLTTRTYGQTGGEETHTLTVSEMPAHTHTYQNMLGSGSSPFNPASSSDAGNSAGIKTTDSTGGGSPHNNMPPFFVVYFIIKI